MKDKRRRTARQKAATVKRSNLTRARCHRVRNWRHSAEALVHHGYPVTVFITVTWSALHRNKTLKKAHAPILDLDIEAREKRLWDLIRRIIKRHHTAFFGFRAPEFSGRFTEHLHIALHASDVAIGDIINLLERETGSWAERLGLEGKRVWRKDCKAHGVIARSECGGYMVQRNLRPQTGGVERVVEYASKSAGKEKMGGQHQLSYDLKRLTRQHMTAISSQHPPVEGQNLAQERG